MADSFEMDQLDQMKRSQLQKLCKEFGIKANSKTSQLITDLKEYKETSLAQQNEKIKTPLPTPKVEENNDAQVDDGNIQTPQQEEDINFKREMLIHLENKVKETMKESKIPRLNNGKVTFAVNTPTNPSSKSSKEHIAFKKMDSIDVYLAKKRKRTESHYQNAKKAKTTATKARNIVAEMKALHSTPGCKTPEKKNAKMAEKYVATATKPLAFGHLKSPKVSGFCFASQKPKTPASRKSFSVAAKTKENKTPHESRKSLAVTPFRFNATANTTFGSPTPAKGAFDLQASLSKPLSYKPHRGKLSEFKIAVHIVESKIPVRTKKMPAYNKEKVDVKSVKITSRVERREKERNGRANRRKNTNFQRRGLVQ